MGERERGGFEGLTVMFILIKINANFSIPRTAGQPPPYPHPHVLL